MGQGALRLGIYWAEVTDERHRSIWSLVAKSPRPRVTGSDSELAERIRKLAQKLPEGSELGRVLLNLDDPANDEASKDRYVALVAGGAVEQGLRLGLERIEAADPGAFEKRTFDWLIKRAVEKGLVAPDERIELDRIRTIRNAFAHALAPVSFSTPEVEELVRRFWHHPVTSWAGYFAVSFAPRHTFAIVCGEFYDNVQRAQPMPARGVTDPD